MYTPQESAEVIIALAKRENTSIDKMLKDCELSPRVVSNMKAGSMPSADKLAKIAEYFNVPTDHLLGKTDTPQRSTIDYSIPPEIAILARKANGVPDERQKKYIFDMLNDAMDNILELIADDEKRKNEE